MTHIIIRIVSNFELAFVLVDGVVGEMHAKVVERFLLTVLGEGPVLICGESHNAVLVKEDAKRIDTQN